jgi:NADPH:quinone reductase
MASAVLLEKPEMRGWRLNQYGSVENLSLAVLPTPVPQSGEVLVEVHAAAINFADGIMIKGEYQVRPEPPFVMGAEIAGVVVASPTGSKFEAGDRVAAQIWTGGYAEYCVVEEHRLFRIPDNVAFEAAAAFPVSYTTAHVALSYPTTIRSNDRILVHAAAGGIGMAAVQLAKAKGAFVIATASNAAKLEIARANGADMLVNYREEDWVAKIKTAFPDGIHLIVDPVGDAFTEQSLRCLGWRGHLRLVGFAAGQPARIPANRLLVKAASATGVYWNWENDGDMVREMQGALVDMLSSGLLKPHIGGIYALEDYPDAIDAIESGQTVGKLIMKIR